MLFRVITKEAFRKFVNTLLSEIEIIAPRKVATDYTGRSIYHYLPVDRFEDVALDYDTTRFSAKTYFTPFKENLASYSFQNGDWTQSIRYRGVTRLILGLHACDINALLKLDKVMARGPFPSPHYIARRKNTLIIGIDHDPCAGGFCRSLGTDTVTHGFDLFLTDLGDRYFVAIDSDRGFSMLQEVENTEVTEDDRVEYSAVRRRIAKGFTTHVETHNLPNILDIEFESPVWAKWGAKCLSCGTCAMVCPTCYCYGVSQEFSMDFASARKNKQLYSCNLYDFARVAGDHNFRARTSTRLKYRYYHQHRGFVETYNEPMCVGCNRCGNACLAGISPPEVIADLHMEEKA